MARSSPYPYIPVSEMLLLVAGLMFVIGSILFVKGPIHNVKIGDSLYIFGCSIFFAKSLQNMFMECHEHGMALCEQRHLLAEYLENAFYNLSCVIFIGGCILYWPGLFEEDETALNAEILAVWCFIIGSGGFVVASFCNAVILSKGKLFKLIPRYGETVYNIAFVALLCSQLGSVLFVAGSFMFRPGFRNHCNRDIRQGWEHIADMLDRNFTELVNKMSYELNVSEHQLRKYMPHKEICSDILNEGTWLFTIGSVLYTLQALLYVIMAFLKHCGEEVEDMGHEEEDGESISKGGEQHPEEGREDEEADGSETDEEEQSSGLRLCPALRL